MIRAKIDLNLQGVLSASLLDLVLWFDLWTGKGLGYRQTYDVDEMSKDPGCLWVSQRTGRIFWLISRQEALVQECIVAPNGELAGVFEMYATNELELFARHHGVLSVLAVDHVVV